MTVLVDSDILIEVTRGRNQDVISRWRELKSAENVVLYCAVTAAELWADVLPHEREILTNFFRTLLCAPIDYEAGFLAGDYLRHYAKSHHLEIADALIAAVAVLNHAQLWTRNRKHYPMKQLSFY